MLHAGMPPMNAPQQNQQGHPPAGYGPHGGNGVNPPVDVGGVEIDVLGRVYTFIKQRRYREAEDSLLQALRSSPQNAKFNLTYALYLLEIRNDWQAANPCASPQDAMWPYRAVRAVVRVCNACFRHCALRYLSAVLQAEPANTDAMVIKAWMAFKFEHNQEARARKHWLCTKSGGSTSACLASLDGFVWFGFAHRRL
jgi:hypothetical protein